MNFEEWLEMYQDKKVINLTLYFTEKDFRVLKKLGVNIQDTVCTGHDYELIKLIIADYYLDKNMTAEEKEGVKLLTDVGVSKHEYNKILKKINKLDCKYNELLKNI